MPSLEMIQSLFANYALGINGVCIGERCWRFGRRESWRSPDTFRGASITGCISNGRHHAPAAADGVSESRNRAWRSAQCPGVFQQREPRQPLVPLLNELQPSSVTRGAIHPHLQCAIGRLSAVPLYEKRPISYSLGAAAFRQGSPTFIHSTLHSNRG